MGQAPPPGALAIDYQGSRYALGRTGDSYAIWDLSTPADPIETYSLSQDGWTQAWNRYRELEGPGAEAQAVGPTPSLIKTWEKGRPLALGPMRVGQILDGAFRLYRMHFRTLVPIVALVVFPFEALFLALTLLTLEPVAAVPGFEEFTFGQQPALWVDILAGALRYLFITPFLTGAVVRMASDAYMGQTPSVRSSYRAALPRVHSILWVTFLTSLAAVAPALPGIAFILAGAASGTDSPLFLPGALLLIVAVVPSVFLFLRFWFAPSIVVVEGTRGVAALRRSYRLVRGLTGKVLGTTILAGLLVLALFFVVGILFGLIAFPILLNSIESGQGPGAAFYVLTYAINTLATILITPFMTLVIVLLYFDSRVRKEGLDLSMMAEGIAPPTSP
jgi:hypothetical protein